MEKPLVGTLVNRSAELPADSEGLEAILGVDLQHSANPMSIRDELPVCAFPRFLTHRIRSKIKWLFEDC